MKNYSKFSANNSKLGISLIAVLMFMLAATTASIVIFRVIGSENFSSGARLKQSEAYMAAESGMEAVQAWLSNKGADVGAMVTKYFSKEGEKKPIDLSSVLGIIRADERQNFKVYLTGIDTSSKSTHLKFKILSVGKARDNSEVKLTAFFDVGGLYKVKVPARVRQSNPINLPAYFGGSMNFDGSKQFSSATVNGDWSGNPSYVEKDFIVTGNFTNSGSGVEIGGTMCVGGEYDPNNDKVKVGDAYFGSSDNFLGTYENVYSNGNMKMMHTGDGVTINGNLTINGQLSFSGGKSYPVKGDLYIGYNGDNVNDCKDAYVNASDLGNNNIFSVCGSVWSCNPSGVRATVAQGARIHFCSGIAGADECVSNTNSSLTFSGAVNTSENNVTHTTTPGSPGPDNRTGFFYSYAANNYNGTIPLSASAVKDYCNDIWRPTASGDCQTTEFIVDDPIASSLGDIEKFLEENKDDAIIQNGFKCVSDDIKDVGSNGNVTGATGGSENERKIASLLNKCYEFVSINNKDKLYNGYLVVKLNQNQDYSDTTLLNGKFILIYPSQKENLFLSPTTAASIVMVFLKEGAAKEVKSNQCNPPEAKYNYFIYSLGDIGSTNNWSEDCPLTGNIYFPAGSCASVKSINNQFKLEENSEITQDLMEAGILCNRLSGNTGDCTEEEIEETQNSDCTGCGSGVEVVDFEQEKNWLAVSSRLKVSLASKNISREKEPESTNSEELEPHVLVMPRVIRLTKDAFNSVSNVDDPLSKFYTFMYLNGAAQPNNAPNRECNKMGSSSATLQKSGSPLSEGVYRCNFSNSEYSDFYVIVKGETGGPNVYLSADQTISQGATGENACRDVRLYLSEDLEHLSLSLNAIASGNAWTISAQESGVCSISIDDRGNGEVNFDIACDNVSSGNIVSFKVCSGNADDQYLKFNIEYSQSGVNIGSPNESWIRREVPQMNIKRNNKISDGTTVYCPDNIKGNNWLTLLCSITPTETIVASNEWSCPLQSNQTASYSIDSTKAPGCKIPNGTPSSGNVPEVANSASNLATSTSFEMDLEWRSYTVTVEGGTLNFSTTNTNIPENERSSNGNYVNSFKVYHGAEYIITASSPWQANCDAALNCNKVNPVYLTNNTAGTTITPTGSGSIKLETIANPKADCKISQNPIKYASKSDLSEIVEVTNLVGYECDVLPWPAIQRGIIKSIGGPIDYGSNGYIKDLDTNTREGYEVYAKITCGTENELTSEVFCGNLLVAAELKPTLSCAWGNNSNYVNSKPSVIVNLTKDVGINCNLSSLEASGTSSLANTSSYWPQISSFPEYPYTIESNSSFIDNDIGKTINITVKAECDGNWENPLFAECGAKTVSEQQPCEVTENFSSICPNTEWPTGVKWNSNPITNNNTIQGCHYVIGLGTPINVNSGSGVVIINGVTYSNYSTSIPEKIDNGYYIYLGSNNAWAEIPSTPGNSNDKPACVPPDEPKLTCSWPSAGDHNVGWFVGEYSKVEDGPIPVPVVSCGGTAVAEASIIWSIEPFGDYVSPNLYEHVTAIVASGCGTSSKQADCGSLRVRFAPIIRTCNFEDASGEANSSLTKPSLDLLDQSNLCSNDDHNPNNNWTNEIWRYEVPNEGIFNWASLPTSANYPTIYRNFSVSGNCGEYGKVPEITCNGGVTVTEPKDLCQGVAPLTDCVSGLGTNAICIKRTSLNGWNANNAQGRTCKVNGGADISPDNNGNIPQQDGTSATADGYVYIYCTEGDYSYFGMSCW